MPVLIGNFFSFIHRNNRNTKTFLVRSWEFWLLVENRKNKIECLGVYSLSLWNRVTIILFF